MDSLDRLHPPGPPSFAPVAGFTHIRSDTPLIAAMLLEPDGPWRDLAPHILGRVTLRLDRDPGPLMVLLPDRVIDPPTPPWVAMRRDFMAGRLRLDPPGKPRPKPRPWPHGWGPHPSHCCATHGCKYGESRCPVTTGKTTQEFPCGVYEMCEVDT